MSTAPDGVGPFAVLLQQYRQAAGFSQEELAERAGLSARGISDLERGVRRSPYPATVRALARALDLDAAAHTRLLAALKQPGCVPEVRGSAGSLPTPLSSFVGRAQEDGTSNNLPAPRTTFVGRDRELAEVQGLVGTTRLVSLVGPGGGGKTRLAVESARGAAPSFPGGVWLVELAGLRDPALVAHAVVETLRPPEARHDGPLEALAKFVLGRKALLVIDNCEHLVQACAELVDALLNVCPELHILATSREAMRVPGEIVWRVPPLALPARDNRVAPGELAAIPAVKLFVDRATAVNPGFALSEANAAAVAEVCVRLDGLPLAIELAAARVSVLSPQQIADRLEDRFRLLTTGGRTAPVRQQTLRAAVEWSYELLSEAERWVFCRLSVFAGGATLELIEEVCSGNGVDRPQVLDIAGRLVDKSLLVVGTSGEARVRYTLLETLRQYGQEQLSADGELAATRDLHAHALLALAEHADECLRGPDGERWLDRLEIEHDNLRTALDWLVHNQDVERSRRLGGALVEFWHARGHLLEGRTLLSRVLALGRQDRSISRARVLSGAALMTDYLGDFDAARPLYQEALAVSRAHDDSGLTGDCLRRLSELAELAGQYEEATRLLDEMLGLSRRCGDRWHEAAALTGLGSTALAMGDCPRAWSLLQQALAIFDVLGDRRAAARVRRTLGVVALEQGEDSVAETLCRETLEVFRALGDPIGEGSCLSVLGNVATRRRDFVAARELFVECLRMRLDLRDEDGVTWSLRAFAILAAEEGYLEQALRLSGAATALRERLGAAFPGYAEWWECLFEQARSALPEVAVQAAWAAGRGMDRDAAVAEALSHPAAVAERAAGPRTVHETQS